MPKLFVLGGPDVGHSFEVFDGMVLGRHPDCSVQLHDRSVSRRHARLQREGDRWYVVDLGSRNGVHLRGERVERAALADLDEISLGELPLRFREEGPAPAERPPAAAKPAPPRPRPAARPEPGEQGLDLEEDIDLTALGQTRDRPRPPRPAPAPASAPTDREVQRARILRETDRGGGLLTGDLAQRPLWVRALVILFVLAVAAALAWGAFQLVAKLRGTL